MICRSNAYVLLSDDGKFLAAAGVVDGELWSVIAPDAPMLRVTRAAKRFVEVFSGVELWATVQCDFSAGCRWLEMLGFKRDGVVEGYPDGAHILYLRSPT